jgi:hypothetical protein
VKLNVFYADRVFATNGLDYGCVPEDFTGFLHTAGIAPYTFAAVAGDSNPGD